MMNTESNSAGKANAGASVAYSHQRLERVIADLLVNGSIELSFEGRAALGAVSRILPHGMAVYLPQLPKRSLEDNLARLNAVHSAGFDPVPHIAARQVASAQSLRDFLRAAVREGGVHRVLLVGGDNAASDGPFADSAALLGSGILAETGIREVDVAGYPEGHHHIRATALRSDLSARLEMAKSQDLGVNLITQFSFVPARVIEYCDQISHEFPDLPIYVGLAGPSDAAALLRFARVCGVSESLRALSSLGVAAARLACHTDPDEQLEVLARYCAGHEASNVIGVHVYSFGGFARSAAWMRGKFPHA